MCRSLFKKFFRLQGCGIRLEDNVLVTEEGPEVLNINTPDTVEELTTLIPQQTASV